MSRNDSTTKLRRALGVAGIAGLVVPLSLLVASPATAATPAPETIQSCGAAFSTGDVLNPTSNVWPSAVNIDKFDPSLGTLLSIDVDGVIRDGGLVSFENLRNDSPSALFGYQWDTTITTTFGETYATTADYDGEFPESWDRAAEVQALSAFDGISDYAGTSGRVLSGAEKSFTATYAPDSAEAAYFVGSGAFELLPASTGVITAGTYSGLPGPLLVDLRVGSLITPESPDGAVGPSACVTYTYLPAVVVPPIDPPVDPAAPGVAPVADAGNAPRLAETGMDAPGVLLAALVLGLSGTAAILFVRGRRHGSSAQ